MMKTIVDVDARQILSIVADAVFARPEHRGKVMARVEILLDQANAKEEKRVIVRAVLFDTEKAAKEYNEPEKADDRKET